MAKFVTIKWRSINQIRPYRSMILFLSSVDRTPARETCNVSRLKSENFYLEFLKPFSFTQKKFGICFLNSRYSYRIVWLFLRLCNRMVCWCWGEVSRRGSSPNRCPVWLLFCRHFADLRICSSRWTYPVSFLWAVLNRIIIKSI